MKFTSSDTQQQYTLYTANCNMELLKWLEENVVNVSKNKIKNILQGRGVMVNGKAITKYNYMVNVGDKIQISKSKKNNLVKTHYIKIVYEDQYLIVIEKNVGVLSMAAGHSSLNVKVLLDNYFQQTKQKCNAHVVHRLDRDTSGLMVYAKDMNTEQILEHEWHQIVYDRRYIAVLSGELSEDEGTIESYLKDNKAYMTYSSLNPNDGKLAITHFKTLKRKAGYTLAEFKLDTGRKNQIRVHSAELGYPICGDVKYGNGDNPINRLALHAYMLKFTHPITKKKMEFETIIPSIFKRLFK